jgi:carbamate kinase
MSAPAQSTKPLAVVAVGGNAILREDQAGTQREQVLAARKMAEAILVVLREGYRLLVVHGNGPQVGRELVRSEEASTKVPPRTLHACVASTQGTMGSLLETEIRNLCRRSGPPTPVTAVVTHVLVSPNDPGFDRPTKPIGPFYSAWRAKELGKTRAWHLVEDAGRGWRQVVPSPRPLEVLEVDAIEQLLEAGHLVIAGGGGGIPVYVDDRGQLAGSDAVIDKDYTAGLLAEKLGAEVLATLTAVESVYVHYRRPEQRALERVSAAELRRFEENGHFAAGSMGPKVAAALAFVEAGGSTAIITTAEKLPAALADRAGTRIVAVLEAPALKRQIELFQELARHPQAEEDEP